uniref:Uncharacterized protein n=1 Tax=Babesia bovis TaxID=5865 RepID=S6B7R9_BABBO|nr:hypothetical protein [Babesia bovis]BAN65125.1 hypothetical protein [Babesia bovis]
MSLITNEKVTQKPKLTRATWSSITTVISVVHKSIAPLTGRVTLTTTPENRS